MVMGLVLSLGTRAYFASVGDRWAEVGGPGGGGGGSGRRRLGGPEGGHRSDRGTPRLTRGACPVRAFSLPVCGTVVDGVRTYLGMGVSVLDWCVIRLECTSAV